MKRLLRILPLSAVWLNGLLLGGNFLATNSTALVVASSVATFGIVVLFLLEPLNSD